MKIVLTSSINTVGKPLTTELVKQELDIIVITCCLPANRK